MGIRDFAPIIASMRWTIWKQHSFPFFVVGDAPVALWATREVPEPEGVGFLTPGAEVTVALDPATLLVARMRDEDPDRGDVVAPIPTRHRMVGSTALVLHYNYRTYASAERFLYGRSQGDLEATTTLAPTAREWQERHQPILGGLSDWERYKPGEDEPTESGHEQA